MTTGGEQGRRPGSWRAHAAIVILAWTLLAVLFLPQSYLLNLRAPRPLTLWQAFVATAALFWVWAALTPLVMWLARRFPLERGVLATRIGAHWLGAFAVSGLHLLILRYVNLAMIWVTGAGDYRPPAPVAALLVGYAATDVMIYWGLVALGHARVYFSRYQDREFRLVEAQLQSMRMQLHPHFLFNTLNAIAELVYRDPSRAERTLMQLSDILRLALGRGEEHEVTLAEEVAWLRNYVAIQQTLLQERLTVRWRIDDETVAARVPTMILQPLVENAIQHGVAPRVSGGAIDIAARREGETLVLQVHDDGIGMAAASPEGVGLSNTRARLRHLYGVRQRVELKAPAGGGVIVEVVLPFRTGK